LDSRSVSPTLEERLGAHHLLADLPAAAIDDLAQAVRVLHVEPNKVLIRNDISRALVDIKIEEEAYHATFRQAIMEEMMELIVKLPPEISIALLDLVVSYSDLPGRDEMVRRIQQIQQTMMGPAGPAAEPGTATS